jgi:surfactin synthase thioesterase subunit
MSNDGWGRKPPVRFPGLLRDDAESVERRQWYADMEKPLFENIAKREELYRIAKGDIVVDKPVEVAPSRKRVNIVESEVQRLQYLTAMTTESDSAKVAVVCFPGVGDNYVMFDSMVEKLTKMFNSFRPGEELSEKSSNGRVVGGWMHRKPPSVKPSNYANVFAVCLPLRMQRVNDRQVKSWRRLLFEIRDELFVKKLFLTKSTAEPVSDPSLCRYEKVIFIGHCLGSLIAFELGRLLSFQQCEISQLIAIGTKSPLRQSKENRDKKWPPVKERTAMEVMYGLQEECEEVITYHLATDKVLMNGLTHVLEGVPQKWAERKDLLRKSLPAIKYEMFLLEHYFVQEPYLPNQDIRSSTIADGGIPDQLKNDDIDDLLDMPPSLFKITVPIVSIHAAEDKFVKLEDVEAWKLSSSIHHSFVVVPGISHFSLHHPGIIEAVMQSIHGLVKPIGDNEEEDEHQKDEEEGENYGEDSGDGRGEEEEQNGDADLEEMLKSL